MTQIHWTKSGPIIFIPNFFVKQKHMTEFKRVVLTPSFINLLLKAVSEHTPSPPQIMDTQKETPYMNIPVNKDGSLQVDLEAQEPEIAKGSCFWIILVPTYAFFLIVLALCLLVFDKNAPPFHNVFAARVIGTLMICSYIYLVYEKVYYYGKCGFYESLWYCHLSLLYCGVALWLNLPTLMGMTLCMVFIPHLAFYIDIICYPLFGIAPADAGAFLYDKNWPLHTKIVTLHHFWYIPCCLYLLYDYPILSIWSYILSLVFFSWSQIWCHYLTPRCAADGSGKERYLNVCISYDAPSVIYNVPPYKYAIGRPYILFFLIAIFFYSIPVNFVSYGVFWLLQKYCLHGY